MAKGGSALCQPRAASTGLGFQQDLLPSPPAPSRLQFHMDAVPDLCVSPQRGREKRRKREDERRKMPPSELLYMSGMIRGTHVSLPDCAGEVGPVSAEPPRGEWLQPHLSLL